MSEILRAAFVAPMTEGLPLLADAAVALEGDEILAVGPFADIRRGHSGPVRDLGDITLAPAMFNSHVHLEMCHLHGKLTRGEGFVAWVKSMLATPMYALDAPRVRAELMRMEQAGVGFLADISTRNAPGVGAILAGSGLGFASFSEVIGMKPVEDAAALVPRVREVEECGRGLMSVAGHALYSTAGHVLQAAKGAARAANLPFSLHLAEHADEDAMLLTGKSEFLDILMARGFITGFDAPGKLPAHLAEDLGLLDSGTLLVHCVTLSGEDVARIAGSGATVCLCPRSNAFIGVGRAPVEQLRAAGVNLCLGTDGLCSNDDLNPYNELAWLLADRPELELTLCEALALVTVNPARFFAPFSPWAARLGRLAPGSPARFSVVPQAVLDNISER